MLDKFGGQFVTLFRYCASDLDLTGAILLSLKFAIEGTGVLVVYVPIIRKGRVKLVKGLA